MTETKPPKSPSSLAANVLLVLAATLVLLIFVEVVFRTVVPETSHFRAQSERIGAKSEGLVESPPVAQGMPDPQRPGATRIPVSRGFVHARGWPQGPVQAIH